MKRKVSIWVLLAGLVGGGSPALAGNYMHSAWNQAPDGACVGPCLLPDSGGFVGPYGQPIQLTAGQVREPTGADYARAMLQQSYPNHLVQQAYGGQPGPSPYMLTAGLGHGPSVPGPVPPGGPANPPGAVAAVGALRPGIPAPYSAFRSEVRFVGPSGMKIAWYAPRADGGAGFTTQYLEAPARYNFVQSSIYRLKLSDIPNRPGVELYPTLEVVPATPKTATFLAHAAIPVDFTEEDFEQVAAGNFIVKVIYLPDPQFQDLAAAGPDVVVSTRLEPGVDPIIEAKRRGSILAIVRLGNIDLEAPNTPAMDAPPPGGNGMPYGPTNGMPYGAMNGMPGGMNCMPGGMNNMRPGMPPISGMPMMPGMQGMPGKGAPTLPAAPAAPTMPLPMKPGTPATPATPLGQLPLSSPVQPVATTESYAPSAPLASPSRLSTMRGGLPDLLGKPTTDR